MSHNLLTGGLVSSATRDTLIDDSFYRARSLYDPVRFPNRRERLIGPSMAFSLVIITDNKRRDVVIGRKNGRMF